VGVKPQDDAGRHHDPARSRSRIPAAVLDAHPLPVSRGRSVAAVDPAGLGAIGGTNPSLRAAVAARLRASSSERTWETSAQRAKPRRSGRL